MTHLASRIALFAALFAVAAGPANASTRFERIAGFKSPGTPARYDKVGILKIGSPKARNVLVLNPGTSASAAYFAPLAESLVARTPGWQVWAVERRENLLEDASVLDRAKAGKATPQEVFNYYLGFLKDPSITAHVRLIPDAEVGFAKQWGMATEIGDLRRVVLKAQALGGKVVVGGHSLGGTITSAYATWDFGGRPGARGLAGLVFIDGGSSPTPVTADQARQSLADLRGGSPWLAFRGIPAPFRGLFNIVGSGAAERQPNALSVLDGWSGLPANLRPPVRTTNLGGYGYDLDSETSPPALAAAQAHLGHLAASGDPRGWDEAGELTPASSQPRRSEEHTSELQSPVHLVCRLLLEKKKKPQPLNQHPTPPRPQPPRADATPHPPPLPPAPPSPRSPASGTRPAPPPGRFCFFLLIRPPPRSPLFPYTTLFRSPRRPTSATWPRAGTRAVGTRPASSRRPRPNRADRKSTRLNSSHPSISYAVFCLKKKKNHNHSTSTPPPPDPSLRAQTPPPTPPHSPPPLPRPGRLRQGPGPPPHPVGFVFFY